MNLDKPKFNWEDPLLLDELLSEEERMVRDAVHSYCEGQLLLCSESSSSPGSQISKAPAAALS